MGCFSFICQGCGRPIRSSSFRGERARLFLLKNGHVCERLEGEYDSYGRVFDEEGESIKWGMEWSDVCNLMFDKDRGNGIAAFHTQCHDGVTNPTVRSKGDPDQGWGRFKLPTTPFKKG